MKKNQRAQSLKSKKIKRIEPKRKKLERKKQQDHETKKLAQWPSQIK